MTHRPPRRILQRLGTTLVVAGMPAGHSHNAVTKRPVILSWIGRSPLL
jgi:hypothetical protein